MLCPQCGQQTEASSAGCSACGAPLTASAPAAALPTGLQVPTGISRKKMADLPGWVIFFCIITVMVSPIALVWVVIQNIPSTGFMDVLFLLWAAFHCLVGASVWIRSSSAFLLLKTHFIVILVFCGFVAYGVYAEWKETQELPVKDAISVLRPVLWVIAWWGYFATSKRVKEVFGTNL